MRPQLDVAALPCLHVHALQNSSHASSELLHHRLQEPTQPASNVRSELATTHESTRVICCAHVSALHASAPALVAATRMHVCKSHITTVVQVLRAFNKLLGNADTNDGMRRELFCTQPDRFLARLEMLVTTMAPRGFTAAALGVLAARDARVLFRDPDWLAVQFEMLRAFFAPYSDAPATVTRMTRGLQASLPAVMPCAEQAPDTRSARRQQIDLSSVHRTMLAGPNDVLGWTREGLKQHMRTLVAAGLFHSDAQARRGCMLRPKLLATSQLRWYVERKAAVLEAGGSMDDVLAVCCNTGALQSAYPGLMMWQLARCALDESLS